MRKKLHEIRDPIHVFVRLTEDERDVLNSRPFQRQRFIHQLALTYLVYPGATHRRFEHALGVMELATRIYDIVTDPDNLSGSIQNVLPDASDEHKRIYWRQVLRVAALCHDVGHLPFSHAAEKQLLPAGWSHEKLTRDIILDDELGSILDGMKLMRGDVVKLALGPNEARDLTFTTWETILAEIIVGDAFGADRMDYLLRDSHHAGVAYGRFDHFRLIDTLRILPSPPVGNKQAVQGDEPNRMERDGAEPGDATDGIPEEPALGILDGGIHSAEALMLARYFMFSQLYFHPVRRIYDIHLKDFLQQWLPNGKYPTAVGEHLRITDNEVTVAISEAARDNKAPGHDPARRIAGREHFRLIYQRHPNDLKITLEPGKTVYLAAQREFGENNVRWDVQPAKGRAPDFPVFPKEGMIASSMAISEPLGKLPAASFDYVFVNPKDYSRARAWLDANREKILETKEDENGKAE
ncbi:MAG: HD domain-containing protein [Pirellulaceae bacterium]|nr:HD domain-containing protein [Pirellulaceae bacterium]